MFMHEALSTVGVKIDLRTGFKSVFFNDNEACYFFSPLTTLGALNAKGRLFFI